MPSNHVRKSGHYNTSLSFPSPELAVLADGAGTLHIVSTGIRVESTTWKVSWPSYTFQGYIHTRVEGILHWSTHIFQMCFCDFACVIFLCSFITDIKSLLQS
jgi:hypothetical protein